MDTKTVSSIPHSKPTGIIPNIIQYCNILSLISKKHKFNRSNYIKENNNNNNNNNNSLIHFDPGNIIYCLLLLIQIFNHLENYLNYVFFDIKSVYSSSAFSNIAITFLFTLFSRIYIYIVFKFNNIIYTYIRNLVKITIKSDSLYKIN